MSTSNPNPTARAPQEERFKEPKEIQVFQRSTLFYWWPVWAVGFILFGFSWILGGRMAVVPADAKIERTGEHSYSIAVKQDPPLRYTGEELGKAGSSTDSMEIKEAKSPFGLHMARQPYLGIVFTVTLLLVILSTNIPLRGLWSVVVIVVAILLCLILYLLGAWEPIMHSLYLLDIHINAAGYLFVAVVLFAVWAVNFFWFDRQTYMIFTPGQMKVCEKIGGGEQVYDTMGMNTQHLQDDFFRHRILGLGSGDLIVRTAGARTHEFHFNNVLFIKRTLAKIEQLQADRPIVKGGA